METINIECLPGDTRAVIAEVARLGRRAVKLGVAIPEARVVRSEIRTWTDAVTGERRRYSVDLVEVLAPDHLGLSGWRLAARLEHDAALPEALVSAGPGIREESLDFPALRVAGPRCDHCGSKRRRAETYLVRCADGRQVLVGSSCLADFVGHDVAGAVAAFDWWLAVHAVGSEPLDGPEGLKAGRRLPGRLEVLRVAAREYSLHGWLSAEDASASGRVSSARLVRAEIDSIRYDPEAFAAGLTPAEEALAQGADGWLEALAAGPEVEGEYLGKLATLGRVDAIPSAHLGILASAIPAWQREQARRALADLAVTSRYLGEVGAKIEAQVQVVSERAVESRFGVSYLYTFATIAGEGISAGCCLKYFASRRLEAPGSDGATLAAGDVCWIVAAVKGHGEFRGVRETTITRGVVRSGPTPPPAPKRPRKGKGKGAPAEVSG